MVHCISSLRPIEQVLPIIPTSLISFQFNHTINWYLHNLVIQTYMALYNHSYNLPHCFRHGGMLHGVSSTLLHVLLHALQVLQATLTFPTSYYNAGEGGDGTGKGVHEKLSDLYTGTSCHCIWKLLSPNQATVTICICMWPNVIWPCMEAQRPSHCYSRSLAPNITDLVVSFFFFLSYLLSWLIRFPFSLMTATLPSHQAYACCTTPISHQCCALLCFFHSFPTCLMLTFHSSLRQCLLYGSAWCTPPMHVFHKGCAFSSILPPPCGCIMSLFHFMAMLDACL